MKIIDKIFRDKKSNAVIYIILAVGILMIVSANSFKGNLSGEAPAQVPAIYDETQTRLENILSDIENVGKVSVMIAPKESPEGEKAVQSVLVVAEGGNDPKVREKVIRAVKAALGIESHKIEVFERKEEQ